MLLGGGGWIQFPYFMHCNMFVCSNAGGGAGLIVLYNFQKSQSGIVQSTHTPPPPKKGFFAVG